MRLDEIWDAQADEWVRFARDPTLDRHNLTFNLPAFLDLVPAPGRRMLDLGCGEGRCRAELKRRGHAVIGVDSSPGMVAAAAELIDATVADAARLPFDDGSFDLVVAFMSLQDMDDLGGALKEAARVLEPGGQLCFAVVHPVNSAGAFEQGRFVISDSYLTPRCADWTLERDGLQLTFGMVHHPLADYTSSLKEAGFVIETITEPQHPTSEKWSRIPLFLHLRAAKR